MASAKEDFDRFFEKFLNEGQAIGKDLSRLGSFIAECEENAKLNENSNPVIQSEYYFCGAVACLVRLVDDPTNRSIINKGQQLICKCLEIIPDDREYNIYKVLYSVFDVNPEQGKYAYQEMKDIYKECPSFRLLDKNLLKAEFAEDLFNNVFSLYLMPLMDNLMDTADDNTCVDACSLLSTMPSLSAKLKSYTYLSRILFKEEKLEESLRTAKLGVDLLGADHVYDHRNPMSIWWAECWTRVATCNRSKQDYDFAWSIYEKGASMGIPSCVRCLGEMYEMGQSEDKDLSKAQELYAEADRLVADYEREAREEQERIEREEKEKEERIRREEEQIRLTAEKRARDEALAKLKAKNKKEKIILSVISALLFVGCVCGLVYMSQQNIHDKMYKYLKQHLAILEYCERAGNQYVIVMNRSGVYYDNLKSTSQIVPVGAEVNTKKVSVVPTDEGAKISLFDLTDGWTITSSSSLEVDRINNNVFLFGDDCGYYLVIKQKDGQIVYYLDAVEVEDGVIHITTTDDLTASYGKELLSEYSPSEIAQMRNDQISIYNGQVDLDLNKMKFEMKGEINMPILGRKYTASQFFKDNIYDTFVDDAYILLQGKLTNHILSQLCDLNNAEEICYSADRNYAFVTIYDKHDKHDVRGLYMIDVKNRTCTCLDHGMRVEYQHDRIRVIQYDTFLIFFDSEKNVYYNYRGNKL